jgi:hypothetical protein
VRLNRRGDSPMQRLARAAQQRAVGGVLHQRVLNWFCAAGGSPR